MRTRLGAAMIAAAASLAGTAAFAQTDDFYRGRTLTIAIGAPAGGIYDFYSRLVGRHIQDFLPGAPTVAMQNMPGAAGIRVANYIYNAAPKDGTFIGLALDNLPLNAFLAPTEVKYRVDKLTWIGRVDYSVHMLFTWKASGILSVDDAKKREVLTAITAPGTSTEMYPMLANRYLGTKFKPISGYEGSGGVNLALERGEVEAVGANALINLRLTKPEWLEQHKVQPLFQIGMKRDPDLPDTPTLLELATTDEGRQSIEFLIRAEEVGFFFVAPPNIPPERARQLRRAFDAMVADPAFLADAKQMNLAVHPVSGEEMQRRAETIAATPDSVVEKFKQAIIAK